MTEHATAEELDRFRRGSMSGAEVLTVSRHISSCAQCRALASRGRDVNVEAAGLREAVVPAESALRSERRPLLIAASVIVVVGSAIFFSLRRPEPAIVHPSRPPVKIASVADYGRDDWNALVRNALESGDTQWPDSELASLRGAAEEVRGTGAPVVAVEPAGVIVETTQPRFTWPVRDGATYRAGIYAGERTIAESPRLHVNEWIPAAGVLQRGVTYTWNVRVIARDGSESIVPAPPASPAKFRVITDRDAADLEAARARFPNDHLLLGLLYARSGVRDRANEELRRYAAEHPESRPARQLANPRD